MARAFVAVRLPDAVLADVAGAVTRVREVAGPGARWTTPEQWHFTLQFLGNGVDLDAVAVALAALTMPSHQLQGGDVRVGGGGAFPSERRARVLWLGVVEGAEYLTQVAGAVGALLAPLGYEPETRPFHAHLTLARVPRPTDLRAAVHALGTGPVGERFRAREVVLYESVTHADGAQYRAHATFPLDRRGGA